MCVCLCVHVCVCVFACVCACVCVYTSVSVYRCEVRVYMHVCGVCVMVFAYIYSSSDR